MKQKIMKFMFLSGVLVAATFLSPALGQAPPEKSKASAASASFKEMFDQSLKDKKGITLYLGGQTISGAVTRVGTDAVELRSQEFSRIVVRMERIDGVAAH